LCPTIRPRRWRINTVTAGKGNPAGDHAARGWNPGLLLCQCRSRLEYPQIFRHGPVRSRHCVAPGDPAHGQPRCGLTRLTRSTAWANCRQGTRKTGSDCATRNHSPGQDSGVQVEGQCLLELREITLAENGPANVVEVTRPTGVLRASTATTTPTSPTGHTPRA